MEKSENISKLCAALIVFDNEVGIIPKDSTNPFFKNAYAALPDILSAIKEPLHKAKLTVKQFPTGEHELTTLLIHESGEFISSTYKMKPAKDDPQGEGSRITYQRRYALGAVLGLNIDEDDDGNKASEPQKQPSQKQPEKQPEKKKEVLKSDSQNFTNVCNWLIENGIDKYPKILEKYMVLEPVEKKIRDYVELATKEGIQ